KAGEGKPAEQRHTITVENRSHRAERVAHDVHPRAAQVEINFVTRVQNPGADEIYCETAGRYDDHWTTADQRRRKPALVSTVENEERDHYQRYTVDQRCDDLEPVVAKGLARSCRT